MTVNNGLLLISACQVFYINTREEDIRNDGLTLIIKLIMIEEKKKKKQKKKNKEGQLQWAEPVRVYPAAAVVSLVSREEAGDPGPHLAREEVIRGETHAAGRTRTSGARRTGEQVVVRDSVIMGNKLLRSSRKSAKKFETPVASSITTYVGISRSPQAKREMEKARQEKQGMHMRTEALANAQRNFVKQTGQIPDKVGLLEYADNVVKKLPLCGHRWKRGFFMLCDTTLYIMSTKGKIRGATCSQARTAKKAHRAFPVLGPPWGVQPYCSLKR